MSQNNISHFWILKTHPIQPLSYLWSMIYLCHRLWCVYTFVYFLSKTFFVSNSYIFVYFKTFSALAAERIEVNWNQTFWKKKCFIFMVDILEIFQKNNHSYFDKSIHFSTSFRKDCLHDHVGFKQIIMFNM